MASNAVPPPHVAAAKWLEKFRHLPDRPARYAANIAGADEALGAAMAKLGELKREENTLVFVIGDKGGASQEAEKGGLRGHKGFVWEGGIRVP